MIVPLKLAHEPARTSRNRKFENLTLRSSLVRSCGLNPLWRITTGHGGKAGCGSPGPLRVGALVGTRESGTHGRIGSSETHRDRGTAREDGRYSSPARSRRSVTGPGPRTPASRRPGSARRAAGRGRRVGAAPRSSKRCPQ